MASRVYTYLLAICALVISITGAYFSVTGLVSLFSGTSASVAIMAGSLEMSKFVVVGFLYRYWGHIHKPLRAYLTFSVLVLMVITSTGIYGYLSNSFQVAAQGLHEHKLHMKAMQSEEIRIQKQIAEYQSFIDKIPNTRITRKFQFQKEYEPKIQQLRNKSEALLVQIEAKKVELIALNTKVGPVAHLASALGVEVDTVVSWLILVFISVFDPLAVSLVFCLNLIVRLREKYRDNEYKIGAHSLTTPVDHRFRKSA